MFNFWWLVGLVNKLEPHPLPLSSQKMKCSFLDYFQFQVISQAGRWTQTPSSTPLQPKNEMLIFGLCSTSDDQPGWPKDCDPICHPSPTKKMKCSFLDYVQLLMIGWAGQWTQTPFAIPLQTKKWYAHFSVTFKFWSLARLVNALEPHLQPLSSQKSEMLIFGLRSTSDDWLGWSMDSNPICHLSPGIKWNAHFCITFNLWWSAGLVNGLKPHLPPLSSQKNEMLIFGLCSTSDDQLGWLMDSNPICHPSPPKKMKCSFLDYVQLLMISRAGWWTWFPSATPLQPQNWSAHFWIRFNFWWLAGLVNGLESHPPPVSSQRMKCSFLDYIQLVMISRAGWSTRTPSATPLQPKKWNACFCITL